MFRLMMMVAASVLVCVSAADTARAGEHISAHQGLVTGDMVQSLPPWGSAEHVVAADGFFFAGQPDAVGFAQAAAAGVTAVINIRGPQEVDWDVAAAVAQAGMAYVNEPLVLSRNGIDQASVVRISALLQELAGEQVLIHCASGNRVALWWALHLIDQHGLDDSAAVALAQQAGMRPALAPLVKQHLQK